MNNRVYIPMPGMSRIRIETLRGMIERDSSLFNRYGDLDTAYRERRYRFVTDVPEEGQSRLRCLVRMLRCSHIYLPAGWQGGRCANIALFVSGLLGKIVIKEEDNR